MSEDRIEAAVTKFLSANFYVPDRVRIQRDTSLIGQGIIDSTGVLELVYFIEGTFGIKISDDEMIPDNLDTVGSIARYVKRKNTSPPS